MSNTQSISDKLMNNLIIWSGLDEISLVSTTTRLGDIQRDISQIRPIRRATQVGFCLLTFVSIVEIVVYTPITALSLLFCPFTNRPYKFCAELLKSSSFTTLRGIEFFHKKYSLPVIKVFMPDQGCRMVANEEQKKLIQNGVINVKEEVVNFFSSTNGWPHIEYVLQISPGLFYTHLQNINAIYEQKQLVTIYLNVSQFLKNHRSLLEVHIYMTSSLSAQQKAWYLALSQSVYYRNVFEDSIDNLLSSSLGLYIHSVHKVYNSRIQLLDMHCKNIQALENYPLKYLKQYMGNILNCSLQALDLYINVMHKLEATEDLRSFQNVNSSLFNLLDSLQDTHVYSPNDLLQCHICNVYTIYNNSLDLLALYIETISNLKNTLPELLGVYILNVHNESAVQEEYIKDFCDLDVNPNERQQEPETFNYLRDKSSAWLGFHVYNIYVIIPELLDSYFKNVKFLTNELPDLLEFYIYNVYISSFESIKFYIEINQGLEFDLMLLERYSETVQCMKAAPAYLVGCHIFNIYKMHNSNSQTLERYIETVKVIIHEEKEHLEKHLYNVFHMQSLLPHLVEEYLQAVQALKQTSAYLLQLHITCLYRICDTHEELLERYVKTVRKILHFFSLPTVNETISWLNTYFQNIAHFIPGSTEDLKKHLHLISQMEAIFEGKRFIVKEIVETMNQEERASFISVSAEIIPYVLAKSIFHFIKNRKNFTFFTDITRDEIDKLRVELKKPQEKELEKIFFSIKNFEKQWSNKSPQPNAIFEKLRRIVYNEYRGIFIEQCWKVAADSIHKEVFALENF